jgi:hypothetical protein
MGLLKKQELTGYNKKIKQIIQFYLKVKARISDTNFVILYEEVMYNASIPSKYYPKIRN